MRGIRAVLLDIDGVLTVSWRPLPGAVEAVTRLRAVTGTFGPRYIASRVGYAIAGHAAVDALANDRGRRDAVVLACFGDPGLEALREIARVPVVGMAHASILQASALGKRFSIVTGGMRWKPMLEEFVASHGLAAQLASVRTVAPTGADIARKPDAAMALLAKGCAACAEQDGADVVILGGAGPEFSYAALNRVFGCLLGGAHLVAMSRTLYWRTDTGMQLDTGAFLAGLEQASGATAVVTGKPAAAFFATALEALAASAPATVMVGDDIHADVLAAQAHRITGVLVRTGKYRPETLRDAPGVPDHVIDSVADLPALLGRPASP